MLVSLLSCSKEKERSKISTDEFFESSSFNKLYFDSDKYLIINVWDSGSGNIFDHLLTFEKDIDTSKVNLVTLCIENDLERLRNKKKRNLKRDITLDNLAIRNDILKIIEYPTDEKKGIIQINVRRTPYLALVKDKKLIYSSYKYNLEGFFI